VLVGLSALIHPSIRTPGGATKINFSPIMYVGYSESFSIIPTVKGMAESFKRVSDAVVCVFIPVQCGSGCTIQTTAGSIRSGAASLCRELNIFGILVDVRI
jgi:hypothetical protein